MIKSKSGLETHCTEVAQRLIRSTGEQSSTKRGSDVGSGLYRHADHANNFFFTRGIFGLRRLKMPQRSPHCSDWFDRRTAAILMDCRKRWSTASFLAQYKNQCQPQAFLFSYVQQKAA